MRGVYRRSDREILIQKIRSLSIIEGNNRIWPMTEEEYWDLREYLYERLSDEDESTHKREKLLFWHNGEKNNS